jgi:hypothetical protein
MNFAWKILADPDQTAGLTHRERAPSGIRNDMPKLIVLTLADGFDGTERSIQVCLCFHSFLHSPAVHKGRLKIKTA